MGNAARTQKTEEDRLTRYETGKRKLFSRIGLLPDQDSQLARRKSSLMETRPGRSCA